MHIGIVAAALFQGQDTVSASDVHWIMIFVGFAAAALVIQALFTLGIAIGALKAKQEAEAKIKDIMGKIQPLIDKAHPLIDKAHPLIEQASGFVTKATGVVTELQPKVAAITDKVTAIAGHAEEIAALAKDKAQEFSPTISAANETVREANETVREVNQKTQAQVDRVNGLVSSMLDTTAQMGKALHHTITQPAREVSGIAAGVKTAIMTFLNARPKRKPAPPAYRAPVGTYEPAPPIYSPTQTTTFETSENEKPDLLP